MNMLNEAFPGGGHVVILGAGASIASTIRNPERWNRKLPSMNDLPNVIFMNDLLYRLPEELKCDNFEQLYTNIYNWNPNSEILARMNDRIFEYFKSLCLPDEPTIYDYLVMSLRPKDVIATFNWDPFLYQAWCRNYNHGANPHLCFLHGSVNVGFDKEHNILGLAGKRVSERNLYFEPSKLLYPTGNKDYENDPFIKGQWEKLRYWLSAESTWRVTIFGYSAPVSDKAAIQLMHDAWGGSKKRNMEQFEMIDIRNENEVRNSWDTFVHSHHYDYCTDFFQSSLAQHPRRTSESYFNWAYCITPELAFHEAMPVPQDFKTMQELWDWYQPLIDVEEAKHANG